MNHSAKPFQIRPHYMHEVAPCQPRPDGAVARSKRIRRRIWKRTCGRSPGRAAGIVVSCLLNESAVETLIARKQTGCF